MGIKGRATAAQRLARPAGNGEESRLIWSSDRLRHA